MCVCVFITFFVATKQDAKCSHWPHNFAAGTDGTPADKCGLCECERCADRLDAHTAVGVELLAGEQQRQHVDASGDPAVVGRLQMVQKKKSSQIATPLRCGCAALPGCTPGRRRCRRALHWCSGPGWPGPRSTPHCGRSTTHPSRSAASGMDVISEPTKTG